jgi:predicted metal-binding membrane protein
MSSEAGPAAEDLPSSRPNRRRAVLTLVVGALTLAGWTALVLLAVRATEPEISESPALGEAAVEEGKEQVVDVLLWILWLFVAAVIVFWVVTAARRQLNRH